MMAQRLKKTLNILGNIVFALMLLLVVSLVFFVVKSKLEGGTPSVAGRKIYIVLSGSMRPVFDAGSVVGVKNVDPNKIAVGSIITFKDPEDPNRIITHRVVDVKDQNGAISYITKGDGNNVRDAKPVPAGNVIGQADCWVPYAGYVLDFAKSKRGLLFLIVLPGTVLVLNELRSLFKYAQEYEDEEKRKKAFADPGQMKTET